MKVYFKVFLGVRGDIFKTWVISRFIFFFVVDATTLKTQMKQW